MFTLKKSDVTLKFSFALLFIIIILSGTVFAAKVDTLLVQSTSMDKKIKNVVITPESYSNKNQSFPVVYLLHGYSGNYGSWVNGSPGIKDLADQYNMIIVCPDGEFSSWYWDSPADKNFKYETYIINELIPYVDSHFKTIKKKEGRAITGLSMGGHGSFYLAFRHQDIFGAAGSQSGGLDIRPFPLNWDLSERLGPYSEFPDRLNDYSVINLVRLLTPGSLALSFECGTNDFFIGVNRALHEKLLYMNIPHDYTERPGGHTWEYWKNSVIYQLLFFNQYFQKNLTDE